MSAPHTEISRPEVSAPNPPEFEIVAQKAKQSFGYINFTVLQWINERHALKRIYSTHPDNYPVGGEKIMTRNAPWPTTVVESRQPYASWNIDELKSTYTDAPWLIELGIHQTICVPIFNEGGRTVAALNFSGGRDQYDHKMLEEMKELAEREGTEAFRAYIGCR
ncbi:hypothetical protein I302_100206 [Kwoniella bestiolae CBS 10118]|uniref:GAF domain-containing protein n=1 Tax=Kwoniella bestiolae CBS 10118 TaxID=1296100 RepID=A0A1B9G4G2_9TREE|nr:hypothetical protein I302_03579 [Kwoniella bestiolae CBS 10118]OCF25903.1 hypothetical protein I302_03579 [Kwoniella bestiolae CBS 10118]